MAKVCDVTGKRPMVGNNRSHAQNKTRRRFLPNLHMRKFRDQSGNLIKLCVSSAGLRLIDKLGIDEVLRRKQAREHSPS